MKPVKYLTPETQRFKPCCKLLLGTPWSDSETRQTPEHQKKSVLNQCCKLLSLHATTSVCAWSDSETHETPEHQQNSVLKQCCKLLLIRDALPFRGTAAARAALPIPTSVCTFSFLPVSAHFHSYQCLHIFIPTRVCTFSCVENIGLTASV